MLDLRQHVGREEHGGAGRPRLAHQLVELLLVQGVEPAAGFVEHQQPRPVHEGEQDPELSLVAGRVLTELETEVQVQPLGDLLHPRLVHAAPQRPEVARDVATAQAAELGKLSGHVADQALHLHRLPHAVEAEDRGRSPGRVDEAHEQADGRALAGPVRAEVAEHLAFGHLEVEIEEAPRSAVILGQALGLDCRRHRHVSFHSSLIQTRNA